MTSPLNAIYLDIASAQALLAGHDSPLKGSSLHPDAIAKLRLQAEQNRSALPLHIELELAEADVAFATAIRNAIGEHFQAEAEDASQEIRRIFCNGGVASCVGLLFASVLRGIGHALGSLELSQVSDALGESLTVFSWVAMWRPAELLLYEHLPVRRRRNLARALAEADIIVRVREEECEDTLPTPQPSTDPHVTDSDEAPAPQLRAA
ncbi:MAG: hypothetical protein AAFY57_01470 [Cyanobacteria bacterium J06642_2]